MSKLAIRLISLTLIDSPEAYSVGGNIYLVACLPCGPGFPDRLNVVQDKKLYSMEIPNGEYFSPGLGLISVQETVPICLSETLKMLKPIE